MFLSSADKEALYTEDSWNSLETVYTDAKEFYDGLSLVQNPRRELYAHYTALVEAYDSLQHNPADYSKVDGAIAKAEKLNKEDYVDFSAVEAAVNAVERGKNITEQEAVDAMAKANEDAISSLEKKEDPADPGTGGTDPDKPGTGGTDQKDKPAESGKSNVPSTGDGYNAFIWLIISAVLGAGLSVSAICWKKKRQ